MAQRPWASVPASDPKEQMREAERASEPGTSSRSTGDELREMAEIAPRQNRAHDDRSGSSGSFGINQPDGECLQRFFVRVEKARAKTCRTAAIEHRASDDVRYLLEREAFRDAIVDHGLPIAIDADGVSKRLTLKK